MEAAYLSLGIDIDVVEFIGLEIDASHPCFYGAGDRVHHHKGCLQHLLVIFDGIHGVIIVSFFPTAVPREYFHGHRLKECLAYIRVAEAFVLERPPSIAVVHGGIQVYSDGPSQTPPFRMLYWALSDRCRRGNCLATASSA